MRFSLILPVYNVDTYLEHCLDSIISQHYADFECLLIDDGSTDSSSEICRNYARIDHRFKYYRKPNGGLSDARNFGLDIAIGDYIVFVDSDDIISPMALKKIDLCINQLNVDIVYFDYLKFYGESNDSLPEFKHSSGTNEFSRISSRELARKPNFAWARVVKKDFYCAIRFPIGFIYEDVLTSPLLCTKTDKIGYISTPLYGYRKRKNSITTGSAEKQFRLFETLSLLKERISQENYNYKYYTTAFVNLSQSCMVSLVRINDRRVRGKYSEIIYREYAKISVMDVLTSYSSLKFKVLSLLSKNTVTLYVLSAFLRPLVHVSDRKGK
ncbi:glycosyl transferase [Enterobacteriaceae bacterium strain FGI 57]|nr:glycosyl transferase [Enterobacteriaceae bacterium strain FGI 57]